MVNLIFESHSTTIDNESGQAAGWFDVELSKAGETQAKAMGIRRQNDHFDAIFCSDLQRSFKTAELAFDSKFPIIKDERLRECNYGRWNRQKHALIEREKPNRIITTHPNGESWSQAINRVIECLKEIEKKFDGKTVLVIGHRATQYGIEKYINNISVKDIVTAPWKYQPGWEYSLGK